MQCNEIREHIKSNPGFRKLHPGYGSWETVAPALAKFHRFRRAEADPVVKVRLPCPAK